MFIIDWVFDKIGYMPKINVQVGVVDKAWPFPAEVEIKSLAEEPKPIVKKRPAVKKPAVVAKTARNKKAR